MKTLSVACLLLALLLGGCQHPSTAPPATPASDEVKGVAQQAKDAQTEALQRYGAKDYRAARERALVSANMWKLDASDPHAVSAMQLLAGKAAFHLQELEPAFAELKELAKGQHLDLEGRQMLAAARRAGLQQADAALAHGRKELAAGHVGPATASLSAAIGRYQKFGASGAVQATALAQLAQCYDRAGNRSAARAQMVLAEQSDPGNPTYRGAVAAYDTAATTARPPAATAAADAAAPNPQDNASEVLHSHRSWQGQ